MRIDGMGANWLPRGAAVAVPPETGPGSTAPFAASWLADPEPAPAGLILLPLAEPATLAPGGEAADDPVLPGRTATERGQGLLSWRVSRDHAPSERVHAALPADDAPAMGLPPGLVVATHWPPDRGVPAPPPIVGPGQGGIMPPAVASLPAPKGVAMHPPSPAAVSAVSQPGQPLPADDTAPDVGSGPVVPPRPPPAASVTGLPAAGDAFALRVSGQGSAVPEGPVHSAHDPVPLVAPAPSGTASATQAVVQAGLPVQSVPVAAKALVLAPGFPEPELPLPGAGGETPVSMRVVTAAAHPIRPANSPPPSIIAWVMPRPLGQDATFAPVVDPVTLPEAAPDPAAGTAPPAQGGPAPTGLLPLPAAAPPVLAMPDQDALAKDALALAPPDGQTAERTAAMADHPRLTDPRPVVPQVVMRLAEMARDGGPSVLEVRLDPEDLGRLSLSMQTEGDVLRVHLVAERSDTLDLMRRHAADLAAELRAAGFDSVAFSFGRAGRDAGAGQTSYARLPVPEDAGSALLPETGGAARMAGDRALDLRL